MLHDNTTQAGCCFGGYPDKTPAESSPLRDAQQCAVGVMRQTIEGSSLVGAAPATRLYPRAYMAATAFPPTAVTRCYHML